MAIENMILWVAPYTVSIPIPEKWSDDVARKPNTYPTVIDGFAPIEKMDDFHGKHWHHHAQIENACGFFKEIGVGQQKKIENYIV